MNLRNAKYDHVYAVVRVDDGDQSGALDQNRVTVTKVFRSKERASADVERLRAVNSNKRCHYFCQITRLEREPHEP